jgi:hypothetical protein
MLCACSSSPKPQPAPIPPVVVKVPTWPDLPADATTPCPRPRGNPADILTDVDLAGLAARWRVTALCNAGKLSAVGEALKKEPTP